MRSSAKTLDDFWPYYVMQHLHPTCRKLHFAGTTGVIVCALLGLFSSAWWFVLCPVSGYGMAWMGHFFFERNIPAAWGNPWLSLLADFRMYHFILCGKMEEEIERVLQLTKE